MATTIWEENTYFDHAFTISTGNVERQTHTCVVPYRRSDQRTQDDRQREMENVINIANNKTLTYSQDRKMAKSA